MCSWYASISFVTAEKTGHCWALRRGVVWDYAGREDGTAGYLESSQGHWVTGVRASWHDWRKHTTRQTSMHNQRHTHLHTHKVRLKNMIKNSVELITSQAIYMSTHAEHLCPPPFIVLVWLILFSSMMIMISLAVKYKCKFTSIFLDKPLGKEASLYSFGRRRGTFLKENALNRRHYQFHFCHPPGFVILSSICLCVVLCMWTHQHQQHSWAWLCHTCWVSLKTPAASHPNMSKTSVERWCFLKLYPT